MDFLVLLVVLSYVQSAWCKLIIYHLVCWLNFVNSFVRFRESSIIYDCSVIIYSDMVHRHKVRRSLQEVLHQARVNGHLVCGVHDAANELAV